MQQRLQSAHALIQAHLGNDIEPIDVWRRVEDHRAYWRPERVRLILLAESHVRTSQQELERRLSVQAGMPAGLPTGFVRLVYSLGYGEDEALDRPVGRPRNDGTWQFWKIFYSCVNPVRSNSDFAPVLKGGTRALQTRLANKIDVLRQLKARGVWRE
jgi:hypothetical protein